MSNSTNVLKKIENDLAAFQRGVQRLAESEVFDAADCRDAYNRLYALIERYDYERPHLEPFQQQSLDKARKDRFIDGMMSIRVVGAHVRNRRGLEAPTAWRETVVVKDLTANAVFASLCAPVEGTDGNTFIIDHGQNLRLAVEIFTKAMEKAKRRE